MRLFNGPAQFLGFNSSAVTSFKVHPQGSPRDQIRLYLTKAVGSEMFLPTSGDDWLYAAHRVEPTTR